MKNTHDVIIELIQKETFKQKLQDLFSSSQVNQNSKLVTLNPILNNNIRKVGGRLKNIINIPNNLKHQIIPPCYRFINNTLQQIKSSLWKRSSASFAQRNLLDS